MKKLIIVLVVILCAASAMAQTCNVGVAWTPDPVGAPSDEDPGDHEAEFKGLEYDAPLKDWRAA